MKDEIKDYEYFVKHQLLCVTPDGKIDTINKSKNRFYYNIGSINQDGYIRVWCNGKLRMKHRLMRYIYNGEFDTSLEVDHINKIRDDNSITNLRLVSHKTNVSNVSQPGKKWLSVADKTKLCELLQNTDTSITKLAKQFNRSRVYIKQIVKGERYTKFAIKYNFNHRLTK